MIRSLEGTVVEIDEPAGIITLQVFGIGYELHVIPLVVAMLIQNPHLRQPFFSTVYASVRENGTTLYGFLNWDERRLFSKLVAIEGVGPATAMALLSDPGVDDVYAAIRNKDHKALLPAKGVGPKLAQRIIMEYPK